MSFQFQRSRHRFLTKHVKVIALISLTTLVISLTSSAHAWGTDGHQVVANLTSAQLTPRAKAAVDRLLALEPGATLASISTWADEHKNPTTAAWHYVNFPRDSCTYDVQRECSDGSCVVGAIERQTDVLASKAPDEQRLKALKYVVHFVADVHQPLHSGYYDDRGGNKYQIQAFMRGSNLHALWDSGLIRNLNEDVDTMTARLSRLPASGASSDLAPAHAAEESCKIVGSLGFYPERKVGAEYIGRFTPLMEQQLVTAGARLAGVLNKAFK